MHLLYQKSTENTIFSKDLFIEHTLVSKIELAALIRSILFRRIESLRLNNNFDSMKNFYKEYIEPVIYSNILCRTIDRLRLMYGAKIWLPGDHSFCLDYALSSLMMN